MKYLDEYRDPEMAKKLISSITSAATRQIRLMEGCGTHTVSIFRSGIKDLLPENISLISGPGCPVCVTPNEEIDAAIEIAKQDDVILTTFGDMIKVPGSTSSLEKERALGADVRVVYSSLDALEIARKLPQKKVVLLGIGFETTSPTIASAIISANRDKLGNFSILAAHKLIPPAMRALLDSKEVKISGFLCPGHVSAIIGSRPYEFIAQDYGVPCVVAGFEPLDILNGILMLVKQVESGDASVDIQYRRVVRPDGNAAALGILNDAFHVCDARWRGLGNIPESGLKIRDKYRQFDARSNFDIDIVPTDEPAGRWRTG